MTSTADANSDQMPPDPDKVQEDGKITSREVAMAATIILTQFVQVSKQCSQQQASPWIDTNR